MDATRTSVVAITRRRSRCQTKFVESFCTGSLIAPGVVLTAAHCALAEPWLDIEVFVGANVNAPGGRFHGVAAAAVHPAYDERTFENDLALLWLAEAPAAAPLARGGGLAVGDEVEIVGYGGDENGGGGERRAGTSRVVSAQQGVARTEAGPALACGGDSGAPALQKGAIVGVVRSGDPRCESFANVTLLDGAWESFVAPALARPPTTTRAVTPSEPLCRATCTRDGDCPRGMLCLPERGVGNLCGYATLRSGAFGAPCASDDACGPDGACAQVGAGDLDRECRCFTPCRDLPAPAPVGGAELEGGCTTATAGRAGAWIIGACLMLATASRPRRRRP